MSKRSKKATMEVEEALGEALRLAIDRLQKGSMRYTELVDQIADAMTEPIDIKRAARLAVACGAVLQLVALGYARVDGNGNVSLGGGGLMTRDEILQLEPGPEFDRLVALY